MSSGPGDTTLTSERECGFQKSWMIWVKTPAPPIPNCVPRGKFLNPSESQVSPAQWEKLYPIRAHCEVQWEERGSIKISPLNSHEGFSVSQRERLSLPDRFDCPARGRSI